MYATDKYVYLYRPIHPSCVHLNTRTERNHTRPVPGAYLFFLADSRQRTFLREAGLVRGSFVFVFVDRLVVTVLGRMFFDRRGCAHLGLVFVVWVWGTWEITAGGVDTTPLPLRVRVFANGASLATPEDIALAPIVEGFSSAYDDPRSFGAFLQAETGVLPLTSSLQHFHAYPIEARNELGVPVSSQNATTSDGAAANVFLLPCGEGSNWYWPAFPLGTRVVVSLGTDTVELETLSVRPRVFKVHQLVTEGECKELVGRALKSNALSRSEVGYGEVDEEDEGIEGLKYSKSRTSENMFDDGWPIARVLKHRIAEMLRVTPYNQGMFDGVQILRYNVSKAYDTHQDYFDESDDSEMNFDAKTGGINRYATVMLYLNSVTRGGETVFPLADYSGEAQTSVTPAFLRSVGIVKGSWEETMVRECETSLAVRPEKGAALLFYSLTPDGATDEYSLHGGCPVLEGEKMAANVWVWNKNSGFIDQECADDEKAHFEIVNKLRSGDLLYIFSYTNTSCVGCLHDGDEHVFLEQNETYGVFSCPYEVFEGWSMSEADKANGVGELVFSTREMPLDTLRDSFEIFGRGDFLVSPAPGTGDHFGFDDDVVAEAAACEAAIQQEPD